MINTWTWFAWTAASLIAISSTRNPLYLVIILLCLVIVNLRLAMLGTSTDNPGRKLPISLWRFAILLIVISSVFNALVSKFGETILFSIPGGIPLISGPVTLEALVFGLLNGMVLFAIFFTFIILNRALPVRRLIKVIPKAFTPVAVVTTIAITFIPNTLRQYEQIREAQTVRGHRMRGLRDWLPLIMPLLVGGMERAMSLAESMSARGLASASSQDSVWWARSVLLFGTGLTLAGWIGRAFTQWVIYSTVLLGLGIMLIAYTLIIIGRSRRTTSYIQERWSLADAIVISGVLIMVALILIPLPFIDHQSLAYGVYPKISVPVFDPLLGIAFLSLLIPAVFIHDRQETRTG